MPDTRPLTINVLLAANYARGGIRIQIEHANRLAGRGHDVHIFSNYPEPDWIDLHVPWNRVKTKHSEVLGQHLPDADITLFSFYEQAWGIYETINTFNSLPIYFAQGDEMLFTAEEEADDEKTRAMLRAAQLSLKLPYPCFTVSNPAREHIESKGGTNVAVIPNGVDTELFKPRENSTPGELRLLSVGAEQPAFKGIKQVYAAVMKLQQDAEVPPFTFVRASPQDNAFAELPIEVEFHRSPDQETLAGLYADSDLFVGASTMESFYMLPLEAMASGTAVVCSDLPAVRDYALPQRDFLPFTPGDVAGMYSMIKLALLSPATRRQLEASGLAVARRMSWPAIIDSLEAYLRECLERRERHMERLRKHRRKNRISFSIERPE